MDRAVTGHRVTPGLQRSRGEAAAAQWTQGLADKAMSVARAPLGGSVVPELNRPEVREVFKGRSRIVYRVRDEGVDILTLFDIYLPRSRSNSARRAASRSCDC